VCAGEYRPDNIPGLVRCSACGFVSTDISLSADELKALYSTKYFQGEEYRDYIDDRQVIEKHFRARLKLLLSFVSDASRKNLFEIGAAYGFFLSVARSSFANVEGVDISSEAIAYAQQELHLPVAEADFLGYTPHNKIDVACMWDTIEHLASPHLYIEKLSSLMGTGGVVAITTGDIDSLVARMRGKQWRLIHPPTHLHYFSKKTLSELLSRNGFETCYTGSDGQYRSLASIAHGILMVKNHRPELYSTLRNTGMLDHALYLNLYDIMFVIAKKK
jgi:2-polyprenyl-3-methyl-5-hydroxy-6-metoxy-1,4-benzoquinol methylase